MPGKGGLKSCRWPRVAWAGEIKHNAITVKESIARRRNMDTTCMMELKRNSSKHGGKEDQPGQKLPQLARVFVSRVIHKMCMMNTELALPWIMSSKKFLQQRATLILKVQDMRRVK